MGPCEVATLIAALGFAGAMIVIGFLKANDTGASGGTASAAMGGGSEMAGGGGGDTGETGNA